MADPDALDLHCPIDEEPLTEEDSPLVWVSNLNRTYGIYVKKISYDEFFFH